MLFQTFAAADRSTVAPNSAAQIGWQTNDKTLWMATGVEAGDWAPLITASSLGLGNVNNTSDLDKPISTAVAAALSDKQAVVSTATDNFLSTGIMDLGSSGAWDWLGVANSGVSTVLGPNQVRYFFNGGTESIIIRFPFEPSESQVINVPEQSGTIAMKSDINISALSLEANQLVARASTGEIEGKAISDPALNFLATGEWKNNSNIGSSVKFYGGTTSEGYSQFIGRQWRGYASNGYYGQLSTFVLSSNRNYILPDKAGTVALTSDVDAIAATKQATLSPDIMSLLNTAVSVIGGIKLDLSKIPTSAPSESGMLWRDSSTNALYIVP